MRFLRTSNPALHQRAFVMSNHGFTATMTIGGTAMKTIFLLGLASLSAGWVYYQFTDLSIMTHSKDIGVYLGIGCIGAFIFSLFTIFKPSWAFFTAPSYALLEGLLLGSLSLIVDRQCPGIVAHALPLTFATLLVMLFLYSSGIIRVTHRFTMMILVSMGAIGMVYLLSSILRLFHIQLPYIHESGPIGILFSVFVVGISAFSLVLDFDFIHKAEAYGSPKYMEWYGAFSLMLTLVWLYLEILRLLIKLRGRRR
ncbi:MAG: Bax inhibitor-1/YccA family protein [Bacteroidota bacterium]